MSALHEQKKIHHRRRRFEVTKKRQQNVNKLMYIASTIEICDFILMPHLIAPYLFFFDVTIVLLGVNLTSFGIFSRIFLIFSVHEALCPWDTGGLGNVRF
jgi:hypothetical protein